MYHTEMIRSNGPKRSFSLSLTFAILLHFVVLFFIKKRPESPVFTGYSGSLWVLRPESPREIPPESLGEVFIFIEKDRSLRCSLDTPVGEKVLTGVSERDSGRGVSVSI